MVERLQKRIDPIRQEIVEHSLYASLDGLDDLRAFSQVHVFAVWDFMSLLKSLQRKLTCVDLPWRPVGSASTRYLINEIVTGEESDVDPDGSRISHFELYLRAMEELGADTEPIRSLVEQCQLGTPVEKALENCTLPEGIRDFCSFTFSLIQQAPVHVQAAVFTFGREDLIPDMFHEMVTRLSKEYPTETNTFRYYLERHIEVDGDHHSQLALQMVEELCGQDPQKWDAATEACEEALRLRKGLWDVALNMTITA
ncbi:MAG: DUF3050 domain-containing protein [Bacteroidota bacterium]